MLVGGGGGVVSPLLVQKRDNLTDLNTRPGCLGEAALKITPTIESRVSTLHSVKRDVERAIPEEPWSICVKINGHLLLMYPVVSFLLLHRDVWRAIPSPFSRLRHVLLVGSRAAFIFI